MDEHRLLRTLALLSFAVRVSTFSRAGSDNTGGDGGILFARLPGTVRERPAGSHLEEVGLVRRLEPSSSPRPKNVSMFDEAVNSNNQTTEQRLTTRNASNQSLVASRMVYKARSWRRVQWQDMQNTTRFQSRLVMDSRMSCHCGCRFLEDEFNRIAALEKSILFCIANSCPTVLLLTCSQLLSHGILPHDVILTK